MIGNRNGGESNVCNDHARGGPGPLVVVECGPRIYQLARGAIADPANQWTIPMASIWERAIKSLKEGTYTPRFHWKEKQL